MPVDPNLLKVARLLADLTLDELAQRASISRRSLAYLEAGRSDCTLSTLELLKQALEAEGILFLGETEEYGPGVRVAKSIASGWTRSRGNPARGSGEEGST